jgi:hypothetical protein
MKVCALCLFVLLSIVAARAQGTVWFQNIGPGFNAPVFESDGLTPLSGTQFMAELLGGPSANNLASIATTGFLTGAFAGYFNGFEQTINSVAPNAMASVEVRVWNTASGSSFLQAQASGLPNSWWLSGIFGASLGGGVVNPTTPGYLTGLGNSPVYLNGVPEPSALALAGLAAGATILRRLNKPLMTNRRCPTPPRAQSNAGRPVHAPPLLPAAVAYLCR